MVMANGPLAAGSSLAPAVFGLLGAVIGAVTAGGASFWVAWQTRKAAERAWMRDNRREIYDRFLRYAQQLLIACEAYYDAPHRDDEAKAKVESAFTSFWEVYSVVQTVADIRLFGKARIYGYRLWELATSLGPSSVMGPGKFRKVAKLVRRARHDTITEMRAELGLSTSPRRGESADEDTDPDWDINPFEGTSLAEEYAKAQIERRRRPGQLGFSDGGESIP